MEKNLTIGTNRTNLQMTVENVWKQLCKPAEWLRSYYSSVLERPLTMRQTWLLVNAQAAFIINAFVCDAPMAARIAGCVWVLTALNKCRKEL